MSAEKVREDRLRRMAHRQGYTLQKSRTRDPRALTYGLIRIMDANGFEHYAASNLNAIEQWLTR